MALVLKDRVQETATANTTVSFTCTGAVTGFQAFSVIGNTNTTFYTGTDGSGNWESGIGTYTTAGTLVTRTTILASSNAGSAVTFSGAVTLFVSYPATKSVNLDASGNASPLGTVASGTWQGSTVGVAYGGTGVTASSGANSVILRDANQNADINRINQSNTVTTAAAGTTTLSAASSYSQTLIGTGVQTYKMPDATTLATGVAFEFNNNSTGLLTIQDNALATISTISAGGAAVLVILTNATVAGTWDTHGYIPENVTWGTNALALGGTVITGGTWNGGTIASGYGGTGLITFTAANNALYSTSAGALAAGTLPVLAGGTGVTTSTGTGSVVLATSPTFPVATGTAPFAVTSTTAVANLSIGGTAALATSIAGQTTNGVLYQTGSGATTSTPASTAAGQVLTTATLGGAPTWVTPSGGGFAGGTLTSPLILAAGTATNGTEPLRLQSGPVVTSPAAGTLEYDGTTLFSTPQSGNRGVAPSIHYITQVASYTTPIGTANTLKQMFNATTNGAVTVAGNTTYFFKCMVNISAMSATAGTLLFGFNGTATFSSIMYTAIANKAALSVSAASSHTMGTVKTALVITASNTTTTGYAFINGKITVTTGGTIIPAYATSIAAASVVNVGSYFKIWEAGSNTEVEIGAWT